MGQKPLRSVLYVPGSNERAMQKASALPVDVIIFDLEDAVSSGDKRTARRRICRALADDDFGRRLIVVRINDLQTATGEDDLHDVLAAGVDAVLLPKVKTSQEILSLSSRTDRFGGRQRGADLQIWAMMETPLAILNARDIAELAECQVPRLAAFVMGRNDLIMETGVTPPYLSPWVMQCVVAAKAYDLAIIDGVYNRFEDDKGFRAECREARGMGMDGKSLIHPAQIDSCNELFSPTTKEVQEAEEIVALFEQPQHRNANVLELHGLMVERLHYEMALRTLQIARLAGFEVSKSGQTELKA
jgi:citrate lyase subunit beta/citryl-CoA lyase